MTQKRGDWGRVVVQAGSDPFTGRRLQLSGSARTEREAVALARPLRLATERKATASVTLAELVEEWWASPPSLAASTRARSGDSLDNHILPTFGPRKVTELRSRLVGAFLTVSPDWSVIEPGLAELGTRGEWPPLVPTVVLTEALSGDRRRDYHENRVLRTCDMPTVGETPSKPLA